MNRNKRIAVIRVRGQFNVKAQIRDTMKFLRLHKSNHAAVIDDRETYSGMLQKVKDYTTFGEISLETFTYLINKRGWVKGGSKISDEYIKEHSKFSSITEFSEAFMKFEADFKDVDGLKPVFLLHPPRKGFGRKGKKHHFTVGGALGYRGDEINDLIRRMA